MIRYWLRLVFLLFFLGPVFRATSLPISDARGIEDTAHDMIPDTRKVFDAPPADHDDRMFLEVVPDTRNVCRHFHTVRQTDTSDLPQSRVRLLRRRCRYLHANTALERALCLGDAVLDGIGNESHRRRLGFSDADFSWSLDELVNRGHSSTLVKNYVKNKERTLVCSVMLILPKRDDIVNIPIPPSP